MARPASPARYLAEKRGRVRPSFDLSSEELLSIAGLPFPFIPWRDARIAALLSARYCSPNPPPVTPRATSVRQRVNVRLPSTLLDRLDSERGATTRGAFFAGILRLAEETTKAP